MKNFLLLSFFFILISCGKDDECSKEQFVGSWTGTYSCSVWGTGDVVVDVTSGSGSAIIVDEQSNTSNPEFFSSVSLSQDGCGAEKKETVLGSGTTYSASLSDGGNKLVLKYVISALGTSVEDCTYTLEPKM